MPTISMQFSLELGHEDNLNKAGRRFFPSNQKHGKCWAIDRYERKLKVL
jgi:hypothetical protein